MSKRKADRAAKPHDAYAEYLTARERESAREKKRDLEENEWAERAARWIWDGRAVNAFHQPRSASTFRKRR